MRKKAPKGEPAKVVERLYIIYVQLANIINNLFGNHNCPNALSEKFRRVPVEYDEYRWLPLNNLGSEYTGSNLNILKEKYSEVKYT
jgi:hypothetical protein